MFHVQRSRASCDRRLLALPISCRTGKLDRDPSCVGQRFGVRVAWILDTDYFPPVPRYKQLINVLLGYR